MFVFPAVTETAPCLVHKVYSSSTFPMSSALQCQSPRLKARVLENKEYSAGSLNQTDHEGLIFNWSDAIYSTSQSQEFLLTAFIRTGMLQTGLLLIGLLCQECTIYLIRKLKFNHGLPSPRNFSISLTWKFSRVFSFFIRHHYWYNGEIKYDNIRQTKV